MNYSPFKRLLLAVALCLVALTGLAQGKAKYVFYFIGDGMGVNQVNGTETYLAALEGRIGTTPLCFADFPASALVTTYSGTNGVTDSAAAGTALATGHKTKNGALGLLTDLATPIYSVAVSAKENGAAVGVATSVSIDHATPAAFYAHVGYRGEYYKIGTQLPKTGFDYFGGSDFLKPTDKENPGAPDLYAQCEKAGYVIARGYKDFKKKMRKAEKIILFQTEAAAKENPTALPYAIDRKKGDLTLQDITRAGIGQLSKSERDGKGFFFMVEGGKIDWACHSNDAATVFHEVKDFDEAIRVAYEFYCQHPDETLIVVTADHETGGIALGCGPYELHTDAFKYQRMSTEAYSRHLSALRQSGKAFTWELVERDLAENWGFGNGVTINDKQLGRLKKAFDALAAGTAEQSKSLYASADALADTARAILAECALVGWKSGGHSNGYVPLFAIGAGSELFNGRIDNTEIPRRIAKAAGWEMK